MARRLMLLAAGVAVLAFGAACGGDDGGDDLPGNGDIEVNEGELPDGWPGDFPVYDGADLQGSVRGEEEGIEGVVVTWTTGDSLDDVKTFYDDELEDGNWQATGSGSFEDSAFWTVENSDGDQEAQITVAEDGDEVSIIVFLGEGIDFGGDDVTPSGGDGGGDSGSNGGASELPEEVDLPSGFPEKRAAIPDGARIVAAATTSVSGQTVSTVEYLTEDEIESLAEDLKGDLEGEGWTQLSATEADGEIFATYSGEDSTESLTLTITNSQYEGYTQVDLAISTAE